VYNILLVVIIIPDKKEVFKKYTNIKTIKDALKMSTESKEQIRYFKLLEFQAKKYPLLRTVHAIPNGTFIVSKHGRNRAKAEGLTSGVFDIFVPYPRFGKAGLYIEMKWTSTLSDEQKQFASALDSFFMFTVCHFSQQAFDVTMAWIRSKSLTDFINRVQGLGFKNQLGTEIRTVD
jgi:hypothetical protein